MKNQKSTDNKDIPGEVERFNIIFRIQHVVMFTTFFLLAFTGWGLEFAELRTSSWWIRIWGGARTAGIIHRIAGITMILDFIFHVVYVGYLLITDKIKIRKETTIIPLPQDVKDVIHNFLYFLGLTKTKPKFGRFSYAQKFDYWAVFWGIFIMGISGLALAFPIQASHLIPEWSTGWIWQVLLILHSDEAILAIVFIFFWHFYNEHLKPAVFPMSWTWLTGKISLDELKHKHPKEYELMLKERVGSPGDPGISLNDSTNEEKGV